ncbi:hypothetical protein GGI02_000059 [Coemansia sp. RSA 2322]|nr:hypothetical protein GGI02_000059 [Coemansia sp. RSA 2322]KAJ2488197.1 hypothetical protein EV174_000003 [Coemansia sp. RSA 2320]
MADYVYDWSSSEDKANWSLTLLSTNSVLSSLTSMVTTSPESTLKPDRNNNSSGGDTLAGVNFLKQVPVRKAAVSDQENDTADIAAPAKRRTRPLAYKSRAVKKQAVCVGSGSNCVPTRSKTRAVAATAELDCGSTISILPCTPDRPLEAMRPSGSPTRVSGTKVVADVNFTDVDSSGLCKVDKSLVCKGFWEAIGKAGRICLPHRSGKTYNLTQLLLFFSSSLELGKLENIPTSAFSDDGSGASDIATVCRKKRECLFKNSLLQTMNPGFYAEHFMKYPVLYISLSRCKGASFGTFIRALCDTLAIAAQKWIEEVELADT